jgi:dTDP-4-dehydrorhamnose reductase
LAPHRSGHPGALVFPLNFQEARDVKVLVLGANGMLGHRAARLLSERHDVVGTTRGADPVAERFAPRARFLAGVTVEDFGSVTRAIDEARPDAVINCIGIVKQRAEAHEDVPSIRANALFPHQVAQACSVLGVRFVHLSTDCVFTGARGGYTETDRPDSTDLYGLSKLLGEVTGVAGAVTLRTSMVGWEIRTPTGLLEWYARNRGKSIGGFTRAIFSGLATSDLVEVIERLCTEWRDLDGLWHVSTDPISKYDLLTGLDAALGWDTEIVADESLAIDRSLDSSRFRARTGWGPRPWSEAVERLAMEHREYEDVGRA